MNILENEHIKLRAPEPEDLDLLYKWENNSNLWDVTDTNEPLSKYLIKRKNILINNKHLSIESQLR